MRRSLITKGITRTTRIGVVVAVTLAFTACGGDDDDAGDTSEATAAAAENEGDGEANDQADDETAATDAPDDGDDNGGEADDGDTIEIDDLDDAPEECRDELADYLRQLEPIVSDIDWESATLDEFEAISEQMTEELSDIDDEFTDACGQYDFASDEDSLREMIEFAEDEAPGTVGWLEYLGQMMADFSAGGDDGVAPAADVPADCDGAIAYVEDLIDEGKTMMSMPVREMTAVSQVLGVISTECSVEQSGEFFSRDDVTEFMSG